MVALFACLGLAAGCGNSRTPVPSLTQPAAVHGFRTLRFPAAGVSIGVPESWPVIAQRAPLLTVVASGNAVIALWRYPRRGPAPAPASALAAARGSLLRAIRARSGSVRVIGSRIARIGGVPAIELDALERVAGSPRHVLSTHLFRTGGEIVLEEYAPLSLFRSIRGPVFGPVRRSLTLIGAR